ncbi:DNA polymerase III subunit alpha [Fannyhessea vaginae]|uniref:DNA polymerase III subunit alpha n=1 Tax=Fannyhessea vaginae TaxID=82135 RepID=UPI0023F413D4|nr:DNA polymerase III subunit alpha [Fannyhessea vaginae]
MAFVHLHNHSFFSVLDASTSIQDMVDAAVAQHMHALALTDHAYMFGIPDFDLACRKYNDNAADMKQYKHDVECYEKQWDNKEPKPDDPDAAPHDRCHAQWEKDKRVWDETHDIERVRAQKPELLIKPIFGCEANLIPDQCIEKGTPQKRYHLTLLVKNAVGYVNLMKMMSLAANQMMYYKPRTTFAMLEKYHEGLICLSGCAHGVIAQMIVTQQYDAARAWAQKFKALFGDDFYLEIQDHGVSLDSWNGMSEQMIAQRIVQLGKEEGIAVVATNDNHYFHQDDVETRDILSCIGANTHLDENYQSTLPGSEFYFKSEEQMRALFAWVPEAVDESVRIAAKCSFELDWTHMYLPKFPGLREGETSEERFRSECEQGLARKYGEQWQDVTINGVNVKERFEYEYGVICFKGFADYFLIVQEYVRWAKEHGIGVGPGRGSAAGAIVAYAMDITAFDPLENGLMFERFLSLERTEMPDIDMDFDDERRLEVVQHVRELYGSDRVCHVITYSTIKAKQAINDAARVLGYPVATAQKLSKMVSSDPKTKLKFVLSKTEGKEDMYNPDFVDAYHNNGDEHRIIDAARSIEGIIRGEGVHACAILIAPTPVNDHVPTKLDTKGGVEITQYEGHSVADMGLLKMDFLGLRTLTVISKALDNIRASYPDLSKLDSLGDGVKACLKPGATCIDIDPQKIPFTDPRIFQLVGSGRTAGVFQIESEGMTATIKNMKPKEFRQIVALIALYRPGPLGAGMVTSYINRMNGREPVVFYDDRLSDILDETYGTIVYQEQVMQISVKMSGFSKGESDSKIRKPVAKKKIALLTSTIFHWENGRDETTYDHWMNGASANGYKKEVAQRIWDDVLEFASYAFNKSHSAGYAILVMQTAWLKAYFPREYMASVLTSYMGKTNKIVHYISACNHEGIKILPPDINESGRDFTATPQGIRFGFAGIRGVGENVGIAIMQERKKNGPFANLHDFVKRVNSAQANRRVVEALIKAGAFDSCGYPRKQLMGFIDKNNPKNIIDEAARHEKDRSMGQLSLFDYFGTVEGSGFEEKIPPADPHDRWEDGFMLSQEREVLGIYVTDHPLRPYQVALRRSRDFTLSELEESKEVIDEQSGATHLEYKVPEGKTIHLAGMTATGLIQRRLTKTGKQMAIVTLEDMEGQIPLVVFPKVFEASSALLKGEVLESLDSSGENIFIKVTGKLERGERGNQVIVETLAPLQLSGAINSIHVIEIGLSTSKLSTPYFEMLRSVLVRYPGLDRVELLYESSAHDIMHMELPLTVDACDPLLKAEIEDMFGSDCRVSVFI